MCSEQHKGISSCQYEVPPVPSGFCSSPQLWEKNAELSLKTAAAQPHFGAMQAPEWKRTPSETLFPTLGHTAPQHISLKRHLHQDKGALCTADLSACFHTERNHAGLIRAGL